MAEELGVGLSTIVGWMKDEKNIIENSKIVNSKNVKKIKWSPYDDVDLHVNLHHHKVII